MKQLSRDYRGGSMTDEDTTISAKAWANRGKWSWGLLVRLLDKLNPGHCYRAWLAEQKGTQSERI